MTVEMILIAVLSGAVVALCFGLKSVQKRLEDGLKNVTHEIQITQNIIEVNHKEVMRELEEPPLDDSVKLKEEDTPVSLYRDKNGLLSWEAFKRNTHKA